MTSENSREVERVSPKREYRRFRGDGYGRLRSATFALFGCLLWVAITGTTKRKIPVRDEEAEAARRRAAEIDDWSEVVDRER